MNLHRDSPGLRQLPSSKSARFINELLAPAFRAPQLNGKSPVLSLCHSIFVGHTGQYGPLQSSAPVCTETNARHSRAANTWGAAAVRQTWRARVASPIDPVRSRSSRNLNLAKSRATPQLSPITGTVFGEPTTERCQRSRPQGGAPWPSRNTPGNIPCCVCAWQRSAATWLQPLPRRSCGREPCGWPTCGRNWRISPRRSDQTTTQPIRTKTEAPVGCSTKPSCRALSQDSSRNIDHSSHCRQLASNCAFAASRVAARPSLRRPSGFPRTPYSDHDHRKGSAPSPS